MCTLQCGTAISVVASGTVLVEEINRWLAKAAKTERGELWLAYVFFGIAWFLGGAALLFLADAAFGASSLWEDAPLIVCFAYLGVLMIFLERVLNEIRCRKCGYPVFRRKFFDVSFFRYTCPSCGRFLAEPYYGDEESRDIDQSQNTGTYGEDGPEGMDGPKEV